MTSLLDFPDDGTESMQKHVGLSEMCELEYIKSWFTVKVVRCNIVRGIYNFKRAAVLHFSVFVTRVLANTCLEERLPIH